MTADELQLIKSLVEKVNRLEKRLILQETIEQGAGGGGGSYTNEQAQDAVGNILTDTATVDFTYNDAANTISAIVPDNAVTNAKLTDMANATVKGRTTAGSGDPEDLTMAQLVALIEVQALYALLAGRSGGQILNGGTAAGENLTLASTSHATKGKIFLGAAATSAYDGVNDRLAIGAADPVGEIEAVSVSGANALRGVTASQHNTGAQAAVFNFRKSRGNRAGQTTVANGDFVGDFVFQPYDGSSYLRTAQVAARVVGAVSGGVVPTDLLFTAGSADDPSLTNVRMTIKSTGGVNIGGLVTAGAGVNYGQSANLTYFDQGTWLPTITGSTGTPTVTYTTQEGYWQRINNFVYFSATITINTISGGSGNVRIGGLPFTVGNQAQQPRCYAFVDGIAIPGTAPFAIAFFGSAGTTLMASVVYQNNAVLPSFLLSLFGAGDTISCTGSYLV